ncbi:RICIN domain-containing protein [Streptantibioticus parmotrematis]|uniref:NHL domain-containing protein n=1 Tax=Streptantibioticus parmotrematis TaxID=2873249 RepID=UPI0033D0B7B4
MSTTHAEPAGAEESAPAISTIAGTGVGGFEGDEGPAVSAQLNYPYGIAVDGTGTLYFSDHGNHRVRKVTADGTITTIAGTGTAGNQGENVPAVSAQLNWPRDVAVDGAGTVYIADSSNHRIRKVTADGTISTVAGTGKAGFGGDGGLATSAQLNVPFGLAVDSTGVLYVAEYNNHRVRRITTDGKISTVAGTGSAGSKGDGGLAVSAQLNRPQALAVDATGGLYIADSNNHRIRKVAADGTISTVAGTGTVGFGGDDDQATSAQLNCPLGVMVDSTGTLYFSDHRNHRVRKVAADGTISTVAGTGTAAFDGDDGPATSASLNNPVGLAVDRTGALHIADHVNHRIRKVAAARVAGLPASGSVVSWANVRSRLRMGVFRESTKDGAEIHLSLASPRDHQRWRLVEVGRDGGDVLYRMENVRSGKVLEVADAQERAGAVVAQHAYEGDGAHHQHWRLIPVGSVTDSPRVFEIANRNSGLVLRVDTNARTAVGQYGAQSDPRGHQWQLLPA